MIVLREVVSLPELIVLVVAWGAVRISARLRQARNFMVPMNFHRTADGDIVIFNPCKGRQRAVGAVNEGDVYGIARSNLSDPRQAVLWQTLRPAPTHYTTGANAIVRHIVSVCR